MRWVHVKVETNGDEINVYTDGQLAWNIQDNTPFNGTVGFYRQFIHFNDVNIMTTV